MITLQINPFGVVFTIVGIFLLLLIGYTAYCADSRSRLHYFLDVLAIFMAIVLVLSDSSSAVTPMGAAVLILMMSKVQYAITSLRSLKRSVAKENNTDDNGFGSVGNSSNS